MRPLTAVACAIALGASAAYAQETTTPVVDAAPVAPSSCAAFTPGPTAPDPARATAEQMAAAVAGYETWRTATQSTADCRNAERRALNAQLQARTAELLAAEAANQAGAAAFQAQLDAFHARRRR